MHRSANIKATRCPACTSESIWSSTYAFHLYRNRFSFDLSDRFETITIDTLRSCQRQKPLLILVEILRISSVNNFFWFTLSTNVMKKLQSNDTSNCIYYLWYRQRTGLLNAGKRRLFLWIYSFIPSPLFHCPSASTLTVTPLPFATLSYLALHPLCSLHILQNTLKG